MTHRISLIVATKDRPADLRRLLESLRNQTVEPAEIVVVDASREPVEQVVAEFSDLTTRYLRHWPPSGAAQRNAGVQACASSSTLIGFADDDTIFEPRAFENMLNFWEQAEPDILGAAFNIRNYPHRRRSFLKYNYLTERLGLYSSRPGNVSLSGWQTIITELPETCFVNWLPLGAAVFRREVFNTAIFDYFFESYSYLEDLDFSYTVGRTGRLAVVADAGFSHFSSPDGRVSARLFGRYEVRNRIYFVRKHGLSIGRCYLGLVVRLAMSVYSSALQWDADLFGRTLGNMEELIRKRVGSHPKQMEASQ